MSLFWQEHKKLWRSGMTRVAVCGLMLLTLGLQIWAMQCVNFGTMRADGSHQVNGYENIRKCQQYAAQWQTLTDETAQDMVHTYQQILAENPDFDGALADFSFLQGDIGVVFVAGSGGSDPDLSYTDHLLCRPRPA